MVIQARSIATWLQAGPEQASFFHHVQDVSYRHLQKDPYLDNPHVSFHPSPTSYAS